MAKGTLLLQTGQTPQQYDVEVWHKKPDFYRIALTNHEKSITQIILRNQEGVFVLTPHLNKSFRFQSNWPDKQGQVYLFESLVNSIVEDKERVLVNDKKNKAYMFHVKANYQNRTLTSQKIWLDKDQLAPRKVQVMNADAQVLVELTFNEYKFDVKFADDAFDMNRNMTGYQTESLQTMAQNQGRNNQIWPIKPTYMPEGVYEANIEEITRQDGPAVLLKYDGEYQYTVIEEIPKEMMVIANSGEPVDLGFTIGALTQKGEVQTLRFTYEGVDFSIMSSTLPEEEMQKIAASVFGQIGK
jgi:outer membrane lipoprotein-sorting protein